MNANLQTEPLYITVRGGSMAPDFKHGDRVLIDCSDRCTAQPGAFAVQLDGEIVLRLIERIPGSRRVRLFCADERFTGSEIDPDNLEILGRPAWRGRRI